MDIDKHANLEFVADDFEEGEHEKLDEGIRLLFPFAVTPGNAPFIFMTIDAHSGDRFLAKYHNMTLSECTTLLNSNSTIMDMILDGPKNGYQNLRLLKLLRQGEYQSIISRNSIHIQHLGTVLKDDTLECTKSAPELGWEGNYVGDATNALWAHIQTWFNRSEDPQLALRYSYPKYSAIVQASGMGKSRTVDELSKFHFVIPVNLRQPGSSGIRHPPALFLQTALVLGNTKECPAAESFREYMNQGMQFGSHGKSRTKFYEAVETDANVVYRTTYLTYLDDEYFSDSEGELLRYYTSPLREAFRKLCQVLEDRSADDRNTCARGKMDSEFQSSQCPSVVLAFDEAHTLTEPSNDES
ncbi:hypothetical protein OG21DRAFT_1489735 [Imleria badia]|nr:hypothetical protein OG21DRAFT_1489735 [Imleria badia]